MRLIVGLGNPGRVYKFNRHNIGFILIDRLAKRLGIRMKQDRDIRARLGKGKIENKEIILACPILYMNLSGSAVKFLLEMYHLDYQRDMLIAVDDLDLPWGQMRIRPRGSSGGHHGMESIINALGNSEFARIRLGIGRPRNKKEVVNYVLGNLNNREKASLNDFLEQACDCCQAWVTQGINKAMNKFN